MKRFMLLLWFSLLGLFIMGCTSTIFGYRGPYFNGLYLSKALPYAANIPLSTPLSWKNRLASALEVDPFIEDPVVEAFRGQPEYLVIDITQPEEVEDQYVISSITIQYPDGSKIKWTSATTEPGGNRKWYSNPSNTKFYIPYTTPFAPQIEGYKYQVTAIQYLDGATNKDVRFQTESRDYVTLMVVNRAPYLDATMEYSGGCLGLYLYNITNLDSVTMSNLLINNELIEEGDLTFTPRILKTFTTCPVLSTDGWLKLGFSYPDGIGGVRIAEFVIVDTSFMEIRIHTGEDLMMLPKDFMGRVTLMANITIPESFEPFRSGLFGLDSISGNETITIEGDAPTFLLWQSRPQDNFQSEYYMFRMRLMLRIGGANKPIVFENNNVSPAFIYSSLAQIDLVLIRVSRVTFDELYM